MEDNNTSIYDDIKLSEEIRDKRGQTWRPEDYGFVLIKGDGKVKSKWVYRNMELIRIALNEWILKKNRTISKGKGEHGEFVDNITKHTQWKLVIDTKELADIYLKEGLRG